MEWKVLFDLAKKQSLVGVCFAGVQRLQQQMQEPPKMLYLTWMGMVAKIQQRNEVVNRQCVDLQKRIAADGFRSYIMKGQAVGTLYGSLSNLRQSGDIDIYVEGGYHKIVEYVQKTHPTNDINEVEIHYSIFNDTEVEIHYKPFKTRSPITNRRIQRYFDSVAEREFANIITLSNEIGKIVAPTLEFNLVHQMVHIHKHLFTEGIGLRQLMDFYFVLRGASNEISNGFKFQEVSTIIRDLGLNRFASALMWVIQHVFCLGMIGVPWVPNQRDGEFLLQEIMLSGNFGKQDKRQEKIYDSKWNSFWIVHLKTIRFWRFDHWAWFWSPLWRIYTYIWRLSNGYK